MISYINYEHIIFYIITSEVCRNSSANCLLNTLAILLLLIYLSLGNSNVHSPFIVQISRHTIRYCAGINKCGPMKTTYNFSSRGKNDVIVSYGTRLQLANNTEN